MIRAFFRSPTGVIGALGVLVILFLCVFGEPIWGARADAIDVLAGNQKPSSEYWLGTDPLGHDLFAQLLVSTRLTIAMALGSTAIAIAVGIPLGAVGALLPGRLRMIALRGIDTLIAFPGLLVAIGFAAVLGAGMKSAVIGVGIGLSFSFARVASSLTLAIRDREFITAARVVGVRPRRLLFRHIVPNISDSMAIATTVSISAAIVTLAGLSFLGLGVQLPSTDWGRLLTQGVKSFYQTPAAALGPGAAIALAALVFGFVGEALAKASNPVVWSSGRTTPPEPGDEHGPALADDDYETAGESVLDVRGLRVSFPVGGQMTPIVRGVSLSLAPGEMLGIVGESGSGKSMTAMAISQLVAHPGVVDGEISIRGQQLRQLPLRSVDKVLGTNLAVVFQDPMSSLNPAMKIRNQLIEGVLAHRDTRKSAAIKTAERRLREVHLPTPERQLDRYPHELSGGQRQRVLIAMGLMNDPSILIADEPTTALDVTVQAQIMDLLGQINAEHGTSVILISHNLGLISQNCDRVLVMYAGLVVEELPAQNLGAAAQHPYTKALLGAVPDIRHERELPLVSIPGQMPDARSIPSGCAFHTRCPLATAECATERPPLVSHGNGHRVACWAVEHSPASTLGAEVPAADDEMPTDTESRVGDRL